MIVPTLRPSMTRRIFLPLMVGLLAGTIVPPPAAAAPVVCDAAAFGCPASGVCIIRKTWRVGNGCTLDFGDRAVEVRGTLRADQRGSSFGISAGDLTLDGGTIEARGPRDEFAGDVAIVASGAFIMRGTSPRINVSGEGGGGVVYIQAARVDLASGVVTVRGGAGEECGDGGEILIDSEGPLLSNAMLRANAPGAFCEGGYVTLEGGSTSLSRPIDVRGGAVGGEINVVAWSPDGDAVIAPKARLRADGSGQDEGIGSDGGIVFVFAARDVRLGAPASAAARPPHGVGGGVFLQADGTIDVAAPISAVGFGYASGGAVLVNGLGDVTVRANLSSGVGGQLPFFSAGGTIQVRSLARLATESTWDVSSATAGSIYALGNPLVMSGRFVARGDNAFVSVEGCRADVLGSIDARGSDPILFGGIEVVTGALNVGPAARLQVGPCADEQCLSLTTRPGELSIAPGALLEPAPLLAQDPSLPGC